jgi:hypothetical protein
MSKFVDVIDEYVTERSFLLDNNLAEIVYSLPLYEKYLTSYTYILTVKQIPTKPYQILCGKLTTKEMRNLGQFVHEMSKTLNGIKNMVWFFLVYMFFWFVIYFR